MCKVHPWFASFDFSLLLCILYLVSNQTGLELPFATSIEFVLELSHFGRRRRGQKNDVIDGPNENI